MNAEAETDQLHIMLLPLMDIGHMLPTLDMARVFAAHGVNITIVTTPRNGPFFANTIQNSAKCTSQISIRIVKFPAKEAGLPEEIENIDQITSQEVHRKFFNALSMLQEPLEQLLSECSPHALVADMFFPWTTDLASKFRIPRLVFYGTGFFPMCALGSLMKYKPHKKVTSDTEPFTLPGLPDEIKLTRLKLPPHIRLEFEDDFIRLLRRAKDSAETSYGVIVNSFYELEPPYVDHYKKEKRAWHIGPVSLCNKDTKDKARRGKKSSGDEHECLKWLDLRKPNSVVYLCFGSVARFSDWQLNETAMGLEASGQHFIWVTRQEKEEDGSEHHLPEGFEERMGGKGLIIRGWAPQMDAIGRAVRQIMVGEEVEEMRRRARALGEMARRATEEGGSSYTNLNALIEELRLYRA
ncbi:hypothetical protein RJ640_016589 [Escallonia rubra]|uniref:Uncharacterized protein n=1 Tax=Escallonia rubra TaxID=112253 RepID=A0AA88RTB0_9ASTE|nr:hypothetical protein RJ640_016589 [Escallonia rubra]